MTTSREKKCKSHVPHSSGYVTGYFIIAKFEAIGKMFRLNGVKLITNSIFEKKDLYHFITYMAITSQSQHDYQLILLLISHSHLMYSH